MHVCLQMHAFYHPLTLAEHAASVPEDKRKELACCCLNGCKGRLKASKLANAWLSVKEQSAAPPAQPNSMSKWGQQQQQQQQQQQV